MEIAKRLKGTEEYFFSRKLAEIAALNQEGKDVINLGIGNPDLPPHPDVITTLTSVCVDPDVHGYQSYRSSPVLRNAMSEWYKRWYDLSLDPQTEILPLAGSKEGILHICMAYIDPGDLVLVPDPGYPAYNSAVKLAGGKCINYTVTQKKNGAPAISFPGKKKLKRVKLMFVNFPHMPTGQLPSTSFFEKIIRFARKHDMLVVHDNPYSFILNEKPLSMLSSDAAKEHVIELNSLSKSHNMAGWRVGMLCGSKNRIDDVLRFKSNMDSGMFLPVQLAAARALSLGKEWHEKVNEIYRERREFVFELLSLLGCTWVPGQAGMFVWARVPGRYKNGSLLSEAILSKANIFITPGEIFGERGKKFVRVSLCTPVERLREAIQRIREYVGSKK